MRVSVTLIARGDLVECKDLGQRIPPSDKNGSKGNDVLGPFSLLT